MCEFYRMSVSFRFGREGRHGGWYLAVQWFAEKMTSTNTAPSHTMTSSQGLERSQTIVMATHSTGEPFPRTPYPFHELNTNGSTDLASISEWLEIPEESDDYHPESNALTPEDWIACNGQEDMTWVVGEPDWLEETTKNAEIVPGGLSRAESASSSVDSTAYLSDLSSPEDTHVGPEQAHDQMPEYTFPPDAMEEPSSLSSNTTRGVVRRRESGDELQLPERKRPRLERCKQLAPKTKVSD
jgi:hypothetical protein